ncbi:MATE family efflux transporter [Hoeflea sp. YIM 152468]|uniref:MATE family efflux transporter n=1 Tax=Hoeflea sp. YIM 152468 TaxID=3031759 RepID=UPI0023DC383A|nr:MATE family efflux transporter [Hoeflea sp. YIM 152468]MDF1608794.1 MATE family efflux transporter [Hoeflea sp. YIM 152468]
MQHPQARTEPPQPIALLVTNRMVLAIAVPMTLAFLTTPLLGLVDTAVVGRLGDAALLGGLAIAAILFDLVFTSFNFLRSATTGLVAQAMGREDPCEEQAVFWRSLMIAVVAGVAIIAATPFLLSAGLAFMGAKGDVAAAASTYLLIRALSAPAALANYTILGYVLGRGMGGTGLFLQTVINGTNIVLSIWLGLGLGYGLQGVALATVIAEITGCVTGFWIIHRRFEKPHRPTWKQVIDRTSIKRLMALNGDIMIRSFALIAAFAWFTRLGTGFGDTTLAANAILMNFFMVAGYYLDGFATAAEQISGRAIGARNRQAFTRAVKLTLLWGFGLAGFTTVFFLVFGSTVVAWMTTLETVRVEAGSYLFWAALTALSGVLAFEMDGVYIGATWSRDMRNMMLVSLALFIGLSVALTGLWGNLGLWISLNIFLAARGFTLLALLPRRTHQAFGAA